MLAEVIIAGKAGNDILVAVINGFSMSQTIFKIIKHGSAEYIAAVGLREEILRKPLGLSFSPEELAAESTHIHIAGFFGEDLVATAVLVPKEELCKMQRVAVKNAMQSSGIGSKMMHFCEKWAAINGFKAIYCHARATAEQFYLKNNYISEGDYFEETTIPHIKMRKLLQAD